MKRLPVQLVRMTARGLLALVGAMGLSGGTATAFDLAAAVRSTPPGATLRVPEGVYQGPVVIERPMTLVADGAATITGSGKGNVVVIRSDHVTVRGFTIQASGISLDHEDAGITAKGSHLVIEQNTLRDVLFGIYLHSSPHATIRNNIVGGKALDLGRRGDAIRLWGCPDALLEANRVHDGRDVILWFSDRARVLNNTVSTSRYGLHFMYSSDDHVEGNLLRNNSVGTYMMYSRNLTLRNNRFMQNRGPSGYGLGLKNVDGLDATDNLFNGNRVGMYIDGSPSRIDVHHTFRRNTFAVNDIGLGFLPNVRRNTFTENNFIDNHEQVAVLGGGELRDNVFSLDGRGNFWSDYLGYDLKGGGTGDLPYRAENLFENLMDREPKLRLFLFSPAQQAVQMSAQAFPIFRPKAKFVDEHPLMAPVGAAAVPFDGIAGWVMGLCAVIWGASIFRWRKEVEGVMPPEAMPPPDDEVFTGRGGEVVLRVKGLTRRFGSFKAVDDLSFEVERGEAVALWGRNGAGKTTAIKCILGLLRGQGVVEVCGHTLNSHPKQVRLAIGYVPQELNLYDDLTARQVLAFFAALKKAPAKRIEVVLEEVGMTPHAQKRVRALSGGMKQRLALAIALLADPALLLLDEMTSSLDAAARQSFMHLLNHQKNRGKTILFITHRLEEVEALADRVLVLERGRRQAYCRAAQLPERLGLRTRLKLILAAEQQDAALTALTQAGHLAQRNGRGIYVQVDAARKAQPLRELLEKGFAIEDFQLDEPAEAAASAAELLIGAPPRSSHGLA